MIDGRRIESTRAKRFHLQVFDFRPVTQRNYFLEKQDDAHSPLPFLTVKMSETRMCRFAIAAGKFVRECFGADAIDTDREITVGNGCIPCFDTPQRFTRFLSSQRAPIER